MQVTGTFPALSAGLKKSAKRSNRNGKFYSPPTGGMGGFGGSGKLPRRINAPKTTEGRRALAHRKAAQLTRG